MARSRLEQARSEEGDGQNIRLAVRSAPLCTGRTEIEILTSGGDAFLAFSTKSFLNKYGVKGYRYRCRTSVVLTAHGYHDSSHQHLAATAACQVSPASCETRHVRRLDRSILPSGTAVRVCVNLEHFSHDHHEILRILDELSLG